MGDDRLSWDDLRYLEATYRLGTTGRAARELGTSVSTVYRRLAQLEQALGIKCISAGEGRLTEAGQALVRMAQQTDVAIREVSGRARAEDSAIAGEVSLTTVEGMVPLLSRAVQLLTRRHPELSLRVIIADLGPSVRRREVDVAIGVMPTPPESLWGRKLFTICHRVFGTESAVSQKPRRWVASSQLHLAAWESENAENIAVHTESIAMMRHLLHDGIGVGILPEPLGHLDSSLHEVTEYRSSLEPMDKSAWLLTHPELREVPRI